MSNHTCRECPFAVYHMSFGGRGRTTCGWNCKIVQATGIRDNGSIFEINCDDAKMMDATMLLDGIEDWRLYGDCNLDRHLPSPWSPSYWRDEDWHPEYHVARWILEQQECFVTQEQVEDFVEMYTEYQEDARKKVHQASEELVEVRHWLQIAIARKEKNGKPLVL